VLSGDATWILKGVVKEVTMLVLKWVPRAALRQRTNSPLVSLMVGLVLDTPALPPQRGLG
jgi:hypothetical protein